MQGCDGTIQTSTKQQSTTTTGDQDMPATIKTSVSSLWQSYAGRAQSGRFACPVTIVVYGQEIKVTHIYRGYGKTRLEQINGTPRPGKGFQGEDVTPRNPEFLILD
jgi:hypothetical protein